MTGSLVEISWLGLASFAVFFATNGYICGSVVRGARERKERRAMRDEWLEKITATLGKGGE